jgi:predicted exporter
MYPKDPVTGSLNGPSRHKEGTMFRNIQTTNGSPVRAIASVLVAGLVATASLLPIGSALAQSQWVDRKEVVEKLGAEYAEQPTAMGLASNGGVIELFTAPDGVTWTMVLTMPDGSSRLITAGESWIKMPIRVAGSDS